MAACPNPWGSGFVEAGENCGNAEAGEISSIIHPGTLWIVAMPPMVAQAAYTSDLVCAGRKADNNPYLANARNIA
jgi:hypothetical protein